MYNILIVNDNSSIRILLSEICENAGFLVTQAVDGKDGLEKVRNGNFDAVLMDIEMPVMNGFESTRSIKTLLPFPKNKIPVIAVTGHQINDAQLSFHNVCFDAIVQKPYTIWQIVETVRGVLQKKI